MKYLVLILLLIPSASFASVPAFPMAFYGEVSVNGVAAPVGSIVRVYAEDIEVGSIVVLEQGVYGYETLTKQRLLVKEAEGSLVFTVQSNQINGGLETKGVNALTYPSFEAGVTMRKDLDFELGTVNNSNQSSSKSSSGGGGGSSKKKSVIESPSPIVLGVSTSTDEAEVKIVLQKQIIVLLTQLIELLKLQIALRNG